MIRKIFIDSLNKRMFHFKPDFGMMIPRVVDFNFKNAASRWRVWRHSRIPKENQDTQEELSLLLSLVKTRDETIALKDLQIEDNRQNYQRLIRRKEEELNAVKGELEEVKRQLRDYQDADGLSHT